MYISINSGHRIERVSCGVTHCNTQSYRVLTCNVREGHPLAHEALCIWPEPGSNRKIVVELWSATHRVYMFHAWHDCTIPPVLDCPSTVRFAPCDPGKRRASTLADPAGCLPMLAPPYSTGQLTGNRHTDPGRVSLWGEGVFYTDFSKTTPGYIMLLLVLAFSYDPVSCLVSCAVPLFPCHIFRSIKVALQIMQASAIEEEGLRLVEEEELRRNQVGAHARSAPGLRRARHWEALGG